MTISEIFDEFENCPTMSIRVIGRDKILREKNRDEWLLRNSLPKKLLTKYNKLKKLN